MGIRKTMERFLMDERGTETTEWALIIGLLAVGVLALLISISGWAVKTYAAIDNGLKGSK